MPSAIQALIACALFASAARAGAAAYGDAKGAALKSPEGVACTAEGRVVVADTGNRRLVSFSLKDSALVPGAVIAFPELGTPSRVQIDSRGNVVALDSRSRRLVRVSDGGGFGGFVTPSGLPQRGAALRGGWFPVSFKIGPGDDFYVVDARRVVVLDRSGKFLREIAGSFSDVAVDEKGAVFAVDGRTGRLFAVEADRAMAGRAAESEGRVSTGDRARRVSTGDRNAGVAAGDGNAGVPAGAKLLAKEVAVFPAAIALAPKGQLAVADSHGHSIVLLSRDGTVVSRRSGMGWTDGRVYYPGQLCADARGDLFVADTGNHRLQVFTPQ